MFEEIATPQLIGDLDRKQCSRAVEVRHERRGRGLHPVRTIELAAILGCARDLHTDFKKFSGQKRCCLSQSVHDVRAFTKTADKEIAALNQLRNR